MERLSEFHALVGRNVVPSKPLKPEGAEFFDADLASFYTQSRALYVKLKRIRGLFDESAI